MARLQLSRGRGLDLEPFIIMTIVNVTPDSFYAPSRARAVEEARDAALAAARAGARVVDLGGESTRPGSQAVGLDEELERVVPVVEALRRESDLILSIDTRKAAVARAALAAGADLINDISGLGDPAMPEVVASAQAGLVLMHMQGEPSTMQAAPSYQDCPREVSAFLAQAAGRALKAGIAPESIVLDPGIGFGKRLEDNLALLGRLDEVLALGYPLLVGLSRKSFVGALTGREAPGRLPGSLGAACAAWHKGARIFRVHDTEASLDALTVYRASLAGSAGSPGERKAD